MDTRRRRTTLGGRRAFVALLVLSAGLAGSTASLSPAAAASACDAVHVRSATADAWVDQGSPQTNKGRDSILKVRSQGPSGNFRALVRFALPDLPAGCAVESATLRLFAASARSGRMLEARRLSAAWAETGVTWANQPSAAGDAAVVGAALGWREWPVGSQVAAMYADGNHGFLVRDAVEGQSGEQQFHSREKGSNIPQLVIRFGAAPAAPPPPVLECGVVVTQSVQLTADFENCPADGLVIGAPGITVDLGGRTLDGAGLGVGILNEGFDGVTIRNGTVRDFDVGVRLADGTDGNLVEHLTLELNELAGVELAGAGTLAAPNRVRHNVVDRSSSALVLRDSLGNVVSSNRLLSSLNTAIVLEGSSRTRVEANEVTGAGDGALLLNRADDNVVAGNTFTGSGDGTVTLVESDRNTVTDNSASDTSDAAFELVAGSDDNLVQRNAVGGRTNDDGFRVYDSERNRILDNVAHGVGDSGIFLARAHHNVVKGNDFRFNVGGLELDHSDHNLLEDNDASFSGAIAIEISASSGNVVAGNEAGRSGGRGIQVSGAGDQGGNHLEANVASGNNASGIVVAGGGHTLRGNVAADNNGWGIHAAPGTTDGGGNRAFGNAEAAQCFGVVCATSPAPPPACDEVTVAAAADAWIDQSSAQSNKGSDSILKVRSQGPSGNFRALVRFALPAPPPGCELVGATLRLYAASDSSSAGRRLDVQRLASAWTESAVTWSTQPAATGPVASTTSGTGYREWTVTSLVQAMATAGNFGFVVRDGVESQSGEQQFHSREKGTFMPQLVLRYGPAGG